MRILTFIFLLFLSMYLSAQDRVVGRYRDYFGKRIQLNSDSTFKFTWNFDMLSSWSTGKWTRDKDTIVFNMIPIYDTLQQSNSCAFLVDTLVLSPDERPERIIKVDTSILLSYSQNFYPYPNKLFVRKGRLYKIERGKLVKRKQRGFWKSKKWNPWFFKSDD